MAGTTRTNAFELDYSLNMKSTDHQTIMTRLHHTASFVCAAILLAVFATSCTKHYTNIPIAQLRQMTPFKAKVDRVTVEDHSEHHGTVGIVAIVWLKADTGKSVTIGGTRATAEMIGFARSLKAGQTYVFPQVLLDYEKSRGQKLQ